MMERYYGFAGMEFAISMPEERFYTEERRLEAFALDAVTDPYRFRFDTVRALPDPQGEMIVCQPNFTIYALPEGHVRYIGGKEPYIRAEHTGRQHTVQVLESGYTQKIGTKTVLESMEVEHLVAQNRGFLFHCAYIDYGGKAILFTAPSETGKSTQAELWREYRGAEIINGDRAAVRLVDGQLLAEGIPFAGSSQYCKNRSLPIAAIVYLGQAPKTSIRKVRGYEAFSKIWEGISVNTWDKEDMELVSEVVQTVARQVPVFHLPCTPDESAVIALEDALRREEVL